MSKLRRSAAAGLAIAVTGAVAGMGTAGAAGSGVGTAATTTSILSVQLGANGSLLNARILADDGRATIDPKVAASEAYSRLSAIDVTSAAVPALNRSAPIVESRTPGGQPSVSTAEIDLSAPYAGVTIPVSLVKGNIAPATLSSAVDGTSAASSLKASLANVDAAGGLLSVSSVESVLGTNSGQATSTSERSVKVGAVTVVDLGSLLAGLGIDLNDLPVDTVTALLGQLDTTVAGKTGAEVNAQVDAVQAQVDALTAALASGSPVDPAAVDGIVDTLGLGTVVDSTGISGIADATARTNALIDQLQSAVGSLLGASLTALDTAPLVSLDGAEVSVKTIGASTAGDSVASVTGRIGNLRVGGVTIPGTDLLATARTVNDVTTEVNTKVSNVLKTVNPGLGDVVSIKVLEQTKSVTTEGGYNKARAGITAVSATVKVPADLAAVVAQVEGATGDIDDALTSAGVPVPPVATAMAALRGTLGGSVDALSQGAVIRVAEVLGAADFTPSTNTTTAAPADPDSTLPRTGGSGPLMAIGAFLAALALGARRFVTASKPTR